MIRNARNKKHGNKPYQRVDVPPEVAEQLSALIGVKNSPGSPGTSSATNGSQRRGGEATKTERGSSKLFSLLDHTLTRRRPASGQSTSALPSDPDDSRQSRAVAVTVEDGGDEHATIAAARRIALEPEVSISKGRNLKHPSGLEDDFTLPPVQASSTPLPSRLMRTQVMQVPGPSNVVDVEQMRSDLREAFDDFLERATAVMNRHLERLE